VDYVTRWQQRAEVSALQILQWLGVPEGTYYKWKQRYGKVNEHNGWIPRDHWLNEWEKQAIVNFHFEHPLEGYRRLTYMMLDANVAAVAPSTVYRVLQRAGLIGRSQTKPSLKGTGFLQPLVPHQHWHIDVSYVNITGIIAPSKWIASGLAVP
jgi:putative transposase